MSPYLAIILQDTARGDGVKKIRSPRRKDLTCGPGDAAMKHSSPAPVVVDSYNSNLRIRAARLGTGEERRRGAQRRRLRRVQAGGEVALTGELPLSVLKETAHVR